MGDDRSGSAWKCNIDTRKDQCYLHNFLPEMPDLNLKNPDVREKIKVTFNKRKSAIDSI